MFPNRRPLRGRGLAACVFAAAVASFWPLPAACAETFASLGGRTFRAGERLRVEITLPDGAEWDESEAYLLLDGEGGPRVRVTGELDPRSGSFEFRVPNLPTRNARLLLRAGGEDGDSEERGRVERDVALSPEFEVEGSDAAGERLPFPDGGVLRRRGDFARVEWWTEEAAPRELKDIVLLPPGPGEMSRAGAIPRLPIVLLPPPRKDRMVRPGTGGRAEENPPDLSLPVAFPPQVGLRRLPPDLPLRN